MISTFLSKLDTCGFMLTNVHGLLCIGASRVVVPDL